MIAEELVKTLRALPREERKPVIQSILKSAGSDIEERVLEKEAKLQAFGVEPKDALVEALADTMHGPDGINILKVIASAGAIGEAAQGKIPKDKVKEKAREYTRTLSKAENVKDDGMGFVTAIVSAALAVVTAAVRLISAAVKKMKARRRTLKLRLTPLNSEETANIVQTIAPSLVNIPTRQAWIAAQEGILRMIGEIREGRMGYLMDPSTGASMGSRVNEMRGVKNAFFQVHSTLRAQVLADKRKKQLIAGSLVAVSAVGAIGATAYLTK